jgi:glutathione S-transferase
MQRKLVTLSYSPWSERARWALDHHGLAYQRVSHTPFLGELKLRRLLGKRRKGRATVPVLIAGDEVLTDSFDIALYADREGAGAKLIPKEHEAELRTFAERVDAAMQHGRVLLVSRLLASGPARDETLPRWVPGAVRPLLRPVTHFGTAWFGRKYAIDLDSLATHRAALHSALTEFRAALGGRDYVYGTFTWADILLASIVQGIAPVDDRYIRLGEASRKVWSHPDLAADFVDLVTFRDALYARHRSARPVASAG